MRLNSALVASERDVRFHFPLLFFARLDSIPVCFVFFFFFLPTDQHLCLEKTFYSIKLDDLWPYYIDDGPRRDVDDRDQDRDPSRVRSVYEWIWLDCVGLGAKEIQILAISY